MSSELSGEKLEAQALQKIIPRRRLRIEPWVDKRVYLIVLGLALLVLHGAYRARFKFPECRKDKLTYEERAHRILSHTPLIGILSIALYMQYICD
jgi:hypothetical protein